ncbi:Shikimate dehydrogenase [compost metagenome]
MKEYGIIGKSLSHSFSPRYFDKKFTQESIDAVFLAFELAEIGAVNDLLQSRPQLAGLCVTIPYKEAIIPYLDELDAAALDIGAVNCIQFCGDKRKGYNTDVIGFSASLEPLLPPEPLSALVLGTGGASKAVCAALKQLAIPYTIVSRNAISGHITYTDLDEQTISAHRLIVNTTPLGTYPDVLELPPIPYDALCAQHILYDLIYNPAETAFLKEGNSRGARIKNGLEMLELQAEENWRLWTAGH